MRHSPDLNPIEKMWPKMKAFLRKLRIRSAVLLPDAVHKAQAAVSRGMRSAVAQTDV